MGETKTYINASPERVFTQLTKAIDDVAPGPLKVGNQFRTPGSTKYSP